MPVTSCHPEYICNVKDWSIIENVIKGKAKQYIPDIEPLYKPSSPMYDIDRNYLATISCNNYREGARFSNFALQTKKAIVGLATNTPLKADDLPPELDYLRIACTGDGLTLDQLIQYLIGECVAVGRVGLLTDFPTVKEGLQPHQVSELDPKARMYTFSAITCINWDTADNNGVGQLSRVVIHKNVKDPTNTDKFAWKMKSQYLVLELDGEGYYVQYEMDKTGTIVVPEFRPKANGKYLRQIPFTFIGSENNNACVDIPPLKSIVEMNIGHVRNSAIYEDNLKKYGRGTLNITSSLPTKDWQEFYKNRPIILGTEEGYFLGQSGEFKIAQLQPAQEAATAMTQKQDQMVMLGAHIVVSNPANISENTTKLNMGSKISMLSTIVGNVEDAIRVHMGYCAEYQGANANLINFEMSREFIKQVADPLVMQALIAQLNAAAIPKSVVLDYNKAVGLLDADADYDELQAEIDNENPLGSDVPSALDKPTFKLPGKPANV